MEENNIEFGTEVGSPQKITDFQLVAGNYIDLLRKKGTMVEVEDSLPVMKRPILIPDVIKTHSTAGMPSPIPQGIFESGKALARNTVINNCREYKDDVNLFWHNLLTHFIYIYLPHSQEPLEQITELLESLQQANDEQIIANLLNNKTYTLHYLRSQNNNGRAPIVVTNAANGKFVGGVATYGRGSAEEALCRESDLFLSMVLNHCSGDYRKNILEGMLIQFQLMLQTGYFPISNGTQANDEAKKLAEKWVDLITKPSFEGYGIYYKAAEQEGRVHKNDIILTGNTSKLPEIGVLANGEGKEDFLKNAYFDITVLDIASRDLRIVGSNPTECFTTTDGNYNQIFQDVFEITHEIGAEKPCSLIVLPLGCGAFGNKASEAGKALIEEVTKIPPLFTPATVSSITLATFPDNFKPLSDAIENVLEEDFDKAKVSVLPPVAPPSKTEQNKEYVENKAYLPILDGVNLAYRETRKEIFQLLTEEYSSENPNCKNILNLSRQILLEIQKRERLGFPKEQLIEYMEKMGDALRDKTPESIAAFKEHSIKIIGERSPLKILGGLGLILVGVIEIALGITLAVTGSILTYGIAAPVSIYVGSAITGIGLASLMAGCGLFKAGLNKGLPDDVDKLANTLDSVKLNSKKI